MKEEKEADDDDEGEGSTKIKQVTSCIMTTYSYDIGN